MAVPLTTAAKLASARRFALSYTPMAISLLLASASLSTARGAAISLRGSARPSGLRVVKS